MGLLRPTGIGKELYASAMKNIPLLKRVTARNLIAKSGQPMAYALAEHGPTVLDLVRNHDSAEKAISVHGAAAVALYLHAGKKPISFNILSKLETAEYKRLVSSLGQPDENDLFAMHQIIRVNGLPGFKALLKNPVALKDLIESYKR